MCNELNVSEGGACAGPKLAGNEQSVLSPCWDHCFVFLGKTLYFQSASLLRMVEMSTGKLHCKYCSSHPGGIRNTYLSLYALEIGDK